MLRLEVQAGKRIPEPESTGGWNKTSRLLPPASSCRSASAILECPVKSAAEECHARRQSHSCRASRIRPTAGAPVATIATIGQHEGQSVTLRGWLYNLRESGKLLFPIFRDGTGTIQGVAHVKSVPAEVFEALKGLTQESSVIVTGKVRADKRAPGGYELDVEGLEVVQRVPGVRSLSDHPQRAWRRLPDGASPSLGALAAPVRHPAHPRRDHARGCGVL